jgi:hypothetical protein
MPQNGYPLSYFAESENFVGEQSNEGAFLVSNLLEGKGFLCVEGWNATLLNTSQLSMSGFQLSAQCPGRLQAALPAAPTPALEEEWRLGGT